jgi:2-polyprenyl-3-methyl-5-hydroxy-6-metoxy-1,4-benzoquinol methylase
MGEYGFSPYDSPGPGNAKIGLALAAIVSGIVARLPDVKRVCELGCGNGYLSGLLARSGYRVVGVDASESGIEIARRAHGEHGKFVCARIDGALPATLGAERFDAVISAEVIEHLYRPRDLLECANELLDPGGWLVLSTPYHGYLKNLALSVLDAWDVHHTVGWEGGHIKFFSVKTLSSLVAGNRFDIRRFHYFGRAPWLWKNMICVARKRRP